MSPESRPQLAQDFTDEQIEADVEELRALPLADLRRRQDIHDAQALAARQQGRPDIVLSEQIKRDMTTDAISRQTFGEPQGGLHTRRDMR